MTQAEKDTTALHLQRLEAIKVATGESWNSIAQSLGISRGMLHLIRRGEYRFTDTVLLRLETAEIRAGLRKRPFRGGHGILRFLQAREAGVNATSPPIDLATGSAHVPIAYKTESAPEGFPRDRVQLKAPPNSAVASLVVNLLLDDDIEEFMKPFLDEQLAASGFLDRLRPDAFVALAEACLVLAFGNHWRRDLPKLAGQVDDQRQEPAPHPRKA